MWAVRNSIPVRRRDKRHLLVGKGTAVISWSGSHHEIVYNLLSYSCTYFYRLAGLYLFWFVVISCTYLYFIGCARIKLSSAQCRLKHRAPPPPARPQHREPAEPSPAPTAPPPSTTTPAQRIPGPRGCAVIYDLTIRPDNFLLSGRRVKSTIRCTPNANNGSTFKSGTFNDGATSSQYHVAIQIEWWISQDGSLASILCHSRMLLPLRYTVKRDLFPIRNLYNSFSVTNPYTNLFIYEPFHLRIFSITNLFCYEFFPLRTFSVTNLFRYEPFPLRTFSVTNLFRYEAFPIRTFSVTNFSVTNLFSYEPFPLRTSADTNFIPYEPFCVTNLFRYEL